MAATMYWAPAMCWTLTAEASYTLSHFIVMTTIQGTSIIIPTYWMRKLRLRENKLFYREYKASKIGAYATSSSGQRKAWNSGYEAWGEHRSVWYWLLGPQGQGWSQRRSRTDCRGAISLSIGIAPGHRPPQVELGFQQALSRAEASVTLFVICEASSRWLVLWEAEVSRTCPCPQRACSPKAETDT